MAIWMWVFIANADTEDKTHPEGPISVEIWKEDRFLKILKGQRVLKTYPIGLGFNPIERKLRLGDGATPEGLYSICIKNPYSQFFLSVGLNYPNLEDARQGLESELIDENKKNKIFQSLEQGDCPPWDTDLGGEIFIHGRGSGADWTLGCIALDDEAMKDLYDLVRIGTPVLIHP